MKHRSNTGLLEGNIFKGIFLFSLPLLIGNLFQQLYNTVDSYVVGNYVDTNALAAVGASGPIINMLVGLFMGLSVGAGVVISQYFGAGNETSMRQAIHSSLALTGLLSVLFTIIGVTCTDTLLRAIGVPEEVLPHSSLYLRIYFAGIVFSLFYNMAAGILRAMGDSGNPLIYLAAACIVNIILDFLFVCYLGMGIAGVGIATVIAQAVSCTMAMCKLLFTHESYRVELKEIRFHPMIMKKIVGIGFPTALQQSITALSNVVVQSYINSFGAAAIAGYSSAMRVDGFLQLALQSANMTMITFVGQNVGARKYKRVKEGIFAAWLMVAAVVIIFGVLVNQKGDVFISFFTGDVQVIKNGSTMLHMMSYFYLFPATVQILGGALRGAGHSKAPMFLMVGCYVVLRQLYLMIAVPLTGTFEVVLFGWPMTWIVCAVLTILYCWKADWIPGEESKAQ